MAKFISNDEINRKVAVIFATDVVGCSKAIEQDEIRQFGEFYAPSWQLYA